jgi:hypothetical protein
MEKKDLTRLFPPNYNYLVSIKRNWEYFFIKPLVAVYGEYGRKGIEKAMAEYNIDYYDYKALERKIFLYKKLMKLNNQCWREVPFKSFIGVERKYITDEHIEDLVAAIKTRRDKDIIKYRKRRRDGNTGFPQDHN